MEYAPKDNLKVMFLYFIIFFIFNQFLRYISIHWNGWFSPIFRQTHFGQTHFLVKKTWFLVANRGAPHMRLAFERDASAPVHDQQGHLEWGVIGERNLPGLVN